MFAVFVEGIGGDGGQILVKAIPFGGLDVGEGEVVTGGVHTGAVWVQLVHVAEGDAEFCVLAEGVGLCSNRLSQIVISWFYADLISSNMQSLGKHRIFLLTACFKALVSKP